MYQHEIDALNALVAEQKRTNELLEQLLKQQKPVEQTVKERPQRREKTK